MKKIKLLSSLVAITGLSAGIIPAVTGCSCSSGGDTPTPTPAKKIKITLDLNDQSGVTTEYEVKKGQISPAPDDPSRLNCVFAGWYKEKPEAGEEWDETQKYDFTTMKTSESITLYARWGMEFNNTDWNVVNHAIAQFEQQTSPSKDDAIKLCKLLGVDATATTKTTAKEILEENVVGLIGSIRINGVIHYVRCIGAMQDKDTSDKTVALTFQLETLLSGAGDDNKQYLCCPWKFTGEQESPDNRDYLNSTIRKNLNDTGAVVWYNSQAEAYTDKTKSCLTMLSDTDTGTQLLVSAIKTTKHNVATTTNNWTTGVTADTSYSDQLFIPNYYNMTSDSPGDKCKETKANNPQYYYYSDEDAGKRKKKDLFGNAQQYWLPSPCTTQTGNAWMIYASGNMDCNPVLQMRGVAFAFAI